VTVSFDFDGRAVPYRPGQTVGAALAAAGTRSWRTSARSGRAAGLFCGIGTCFECLLVVDDLPDVRACMALADEAGSVTSQEGTAYRDPGLTPPGRAGQEAP